MYIKNKKGQSTVEYVLLMTAVVAVIIAFVSSSNGGFQTTMNSTLNSAVLEMSSMSDKFSASHASTPAPTGNDAGSPVYNVDVAPGS